MSSNGGTESIGDEPTVSVVITTCNRGEQLAEVLAPLLSDAATLEVVVVVDACHDGTFEMVSERARAEPRLRPVMASSGLGQSRARLLGVHRARGEVFVSLDDDVVADPGLVSIHREHHRRRAHALVVGYMPVELTRPQRPGRFASEQYAKTYEEHCARYERDPRFILTNFWSGNFSMRRADYIDAVGDYRLRLRYHEDRDLSLILLRHELKPVFDRHARARHRHARSLSAYLRDARNAGGTTRVLHARHGDLIGPFELEVGLERFPAPLRALVRATDRPRARRAALGLLRVGVVLTGRVRAFRLESALASTARKIAERQGSRETDPVAELQEMWASAPELEFAPGKSAASILSGEPASSPHAR